MNLITKPVYPDKLGSSYKDPDGFVFTEGDRILRAIHGRYQETFDSLTAKGVFQYLHDRQMLVLHQEVETHYTQFYKVLEPQKIKFISYPYEWCFEQLKDAALLTLEIQRAALLRGFTLKDASAFNIQFHNGAPIFIDSLSFKKWDEGPWTAYKQFCEQFLGPLCLMSQVNDTILKLIGINLDGIPLSLTSRALPFGSWLKPSILLHIHLHAMSLRKTERSNGYKNEVLNRNRKPIKRNAALGLIDSLTDGLQKLSPSGDKTRWGNYYKHTNYTDAAMTSKKAIVARWLNAIRPQQTWDFGANDGTFSELAGEISNLVLSLDIDPAAVGRNYQRIRKAGKRNILPLVFDMANPSPDLGWRNEERLRIEKRGKADAVMALALIHHLVFTHNIPLADVAKYFKDLCTYLIIEFVPKTDSQVAEMLSLKEDSYKYSLEEFEKEFSTYFEIQEKEKIPESGRSLFLMRLRCPIAS